MNRLPLARLTAVALPLLLVFATISIPAQATPPPSLEIETKFPDSNWYDINWVPLGWDEDYNLGYPVGPTQEGGSIEMRVHNLGTKPIVALTFNVKRDENRFDDLDKNPDDFDDFWVEWQAGTSFAPGFEATALERDEERSTDDNTLRFLSAGGSAAPEVIPVGATWPVQVGYTIRGNPQPERGQDYYQFPVEVTPMYGDKTSGTPFRFNLTVTDEAPTLLGPKEDAAGAYTQDVDKDGHIDRVVLTFNGRIDQRTFAVNDWSVAGFGMRPSSLHWLQPEEPLHADPLFENLGKCPEWAEAPRGCSQIILEIDERIEFDTGAKPAVRQLRSLLSDPAGNKVQFTTPTTVDAAQPVLVMATARSTDGGSTQTYEAVVVTFSESVTKENALEATDFQYVDVVVTGATTQAGPTNVPILVGADLEKIQSADRSIQLLFRNDTQGTPLNDVDAPALNPEDIPFPGADRISCGPLIVDLSETGVNDEGLPCHTRLAGGIHILRPKLLDATTNIGSSQVTLRFNVPVEADAAGRTGGAITLQTGAFDVRGTQSGGVEAVEDVDHTACTEIVKLDIRRSVAPTDVDETPAEITVAPARIRPCSFGGAAEAPIPQQSVPLRDHEPPTVTQIQTVDLDSNGVIDGIEIKFSEPVRDQSYCLKSDPCPKSPVDPFITLLHPDPLLRSKYDLTDYGPFFFDTNTRTHKIADDEWITLKWPQNDPSAANPLFTGFVPDVVLKEGLINDMVPDVNTVVKSNRMEALATEGVEELDTAPPIVRLAKTMDTETRDHATNKPCVYVEDLNERCLRSPDGYIDGYWVEFTEPIQDSSFNVLEWDVEGREIERTGRSSRMGEDGINDHILFIPFKEILVRNATVLGDTGETPELTYQKRIGSGGLRDLKGIALDPVSDPTKLDLGKGDIDELDGAEPVIVLAEGFVGKKQLHVLFSESVDDGVGGPLTSSSFLYKNIRTGGAGGIANNPQVEHIPGARFAIVHLDQPLTESDFKGDQLLAYYNAPTEQGAIYERTTKLVNQTLFVSGEPRNITKARDLVPPSNITDLKVAYVGPNQVVLEWTAPSDDGDGQIPVDHYSIYVGATPSTSFAGTGVRPPGGDKLHSSAHTLPAGVTVKSYEPDLARPGAPQLVEITGLQPDTRYYVAVVAVDNDNATRPDNGLDANRTMGSLKAATADFRTTFDSSPPVGTLSITVAGLKDGKTSDPNLRVSWNPLSDPETKDIMYRFKLSRSATDEVTADDQFTTKTNTTFTLPSLGEWYIHVRGFSGDEKGQPAYKLVTLVPPPVDSAAVRAYALDFNDPTADNHSVQVKRTSDGNQINWTLPADPPGDIEAIQVWRLDGTTWTLVGNRTGTYAQLREGGIMDPDGTAASRYFVAPVYAGGQTEDPTAMGLLASQATSVAGSGGLGLLWWGLGLLGLLLIAGIVVLFVVLRGRQQAVPAPEDPDAAEGWADVSETGALPTHEIDCPQCGHHFTATGHLPMPITCPECGVSGKLE